MPGGGVRALRPIRVLLVSADARFARVTGFLLARSGFVVETARPRDLLELTAQHVPSIVILDCGESLVAGARRLGALEALYPEIGVVVVADDPDSAPSSLRVLRKWGGYERLVEEVVQAYLQSGNLQERVHVSES